MKEGREKTKQRGYAAAVVTVAALFAAGFAMQSLTGPFDIRLLAWPANILVGTTLLAAALFAAVFRLSSFFRWISGVPVSVTAICGLAVVGIVMGLLPQTATVEIVDSPLPGGFHNIVSSWPFVLLYTFIMFVLACVTLRRAVNFRLSDIRFYLNHIGLLVLLFASGFGSADRERYTMQVHTGDTEWWASDKTGHVAELPVAVALEKFDMEVYPPTIVLVDHRTGEALPAGKPRYIASDGPGGSVAEWEITIDTYIHNAVKEETGSYREVDMPGAYPAAHLTVRNAATGKDYHGWVSSGNPAAAPDILFLDGGIYAVMTRPEPKRYISHIRYYTVDGTTGSAALEVNKPVRVGSWMIYQYGYDTEAGRMSSYSVLELVYDPWLIPVYIGIAMLALGSLMMLWRGKKRSRTGNDSGPARETDASRIGAEPASKHVPARDMPADAPDHNSVSGNKEGSV